jgi:hypothetical protein
MKTTVHSSITILRQPEELARIFLDPDKALLWNTGLEKFEVLSRTPGLVGSKARLHFAQGARRYLMEDELLEVEPERRYLSRVSGDLLEAEVETTLTPVEGGTAAAVRWTGSGRGPLLRLALPLMRRSLSRQIRADLAKLNNLAEGA